MLILFQFVKIYTYLQRLMFIRVSQMKIFQGFSYYLQTCFTVVHIYYVFSS